MGNCCGAKTNTGDMILDDGGEGGVTY